MASDFLGAVESGASGGPVFSREGLDLIRTFEGFRPDAYYDLGKNKGTLTVGYGFTKADIPDLKPGYKIDQRRAEEMLPGLLNKKYGPTVLQNVKVPLSDQQYSALTSFAYNVGPTAFKNSTLLKKLNAGDIEGASGEFDRWVFAGGKPVDGLVKRRAAEKALFKGDIQTLGSILEGQKFIMPQKGGLSDLSGDAFIRSIAERASEGDIEQKLPVKPNPEMERMLKSGELVQKLPVKRNKSGQFPNVEAQDYLSPLGSNGKETDAEIKKRLGLRSDEDWKKMENDLAKATAGLKEPPSLDGSSPKQEIAKANPEDVFAGVQSNPLPPEGFPVESIFKAFGKEVPDISKIGSNAKADIKMSPLDVLTGLAAGGLAKMRNAAVDYWRQGGAMTPMPDDPEGIEEELPKFDPEMTMPTFAGTGYMSQGLNDYQGLRRIS